MTEKHSIDLLPPSAANAFRIGLEVSTVAWHYSQLAVPSCHEKHLEEIHRGLMQIKSLCEKRGAMPPNHEIAQAIKALGTWPESMKSQAFAEDNMEVRAEWDCSEKCDSDLLRLVEGLTGLTPRVEFQMDWAIRGNLLRTCPQSIRAAYDFGKLLDEGRHSRRLPESIMRWPSEGGSRTPIASTREAMPNLDGPRAKCPRTLKSPSSGIARTKRVIFPDSSAVVPAEPNEGEISPPENWWFKLKELANQVGIPIESGEPDNAETRCNFVKKVTEQTIARLEKERSEFGSWRFIDGKFQYLDGKWFKMSPQQTRLFAEFLEHDGQLFRTLLMKVDRKFRYSSQKALSSAMCRLKSELKNNLKKQMGKNLPEHLIISDNSAQEFSYNLAPKIC